MMTIGFYNPQAEPYPGPRTQNPGAERDRRRGNCVSKKFSLRHWQWRAAPATRDEANEAPSIHTHTTPIFAFRCFAFSNNATNASQATGDASNRENGLEMAGRGCFSLPSCASLASVPAPS